MTPIITFQCSECGETATNHYSEPFRTEMGERKLCYGCNYWKNFSLNNNPRELTIIDGGLYSPGDRTTGSFRGMAGRRFDIEYLETSCFAGQRCTTFDLWSGGELPLALREAFPDTAKFLSGAYQTKVGETTCWNGSDPRTAPYPLPHNLRKS